MDTPHALHLVKRYYTLHTANLSNIFDARAMKKIMLDTLPRPVVIPREMQSSHRNESNKWGDRTGGDKALFIGGHNMLP